MIRLPAVLICLTFHELAHGFVAYKLGDNTAKNQGRLTLNPMAHLDPIGTICLIFAGFGWAKPVPITPYHFKMKNKKIGIALTALAGPLANIILAFIGLIIFLLVAMFGGGGSLATAFSRFVYQLVFMSIGLAVFNLIPIPPLDGSKVLMPFMPNKVLEFTYKYEGFIRFFFLIAVFLDMFSGIISKGIMFIFNHMLNFIAFLFQMIGVL